MMKNYFDLAAEWGKYGITVNSICPGYFYTDLTRDTLNLLTIMGQREDSLSFFCTGAK